MHMYMYMYITHDSVTMQVYKYMYMYVTCYVTYNSSLLSDRDGSNVVHHYQEVATDVGSQRDLHRPVLCVEAANGLHCLVCG